MLQRINKFHIAIIVIIVLSILLFLKYTSSRNTGIVYTTSKVDRNDITSQISTTGNLNPLKTIDVQTLVPGTVKKLNVDFNSQVKLGDPLAELYKNVLETEVESAEAENRKARSGYEQAKKIFENDKYLYEKKFISKEEFDNSKSRYSSSRAAYDQSKVALKKFKFNLENAVIRSPIDGVVLSRSIERGQVVTPNDKPLFIVAENMSQMKIDTNVSETHIGKVNKDQKVFFTVDAYPNEIFEGIVSQIRNDPIITNNVVTYNVVIEVENKDLKLKPGMTAEVNIVVADKKDVLRVPSAALRYIPPPTAKIKIDPKENYYDSHVWMLLNTEELTSVQVKTGKSDDFYTEILDGQLKEGQEVVVGSSSKETTDSNQYLPQPGRF